MNLDVKLAKITGWLLSRPKLTGFFVFLFLLLLIGLITNQRYKIVKENEHREMLSILSVVKQNIDQSLKNSYTAALTLALTIDDRGEPKNFDAVAAQLMATNTKFKAVQLVPNGIIKYIYPLKGNEGALNYNVFISKKDNKYRAYSSVKHRKMYFLGPDKLYQGGIGIVGRLPIYIENRFWGFSAVVLDLNTFLSDVGVLNAKDKRFYFQFSKFNITSGKEEFYLPGSTNFSNKSYEIATFPDGNWRLYIISADPGAAVLQILYPLSLGVFLAVICAILVTQLLKKPAELQRLVDIQAVKLMETELKFKAIFDEAAIGIAVVNSRNGNFLQVNKKLCEILGYNEQELNDLSLQSVT
ncbi:MAG: PAS domain S-box protein, partial [Pedobacter sp.]